MSCLALHRLPLEDARPDLDELAVAVHALPSPVLLADVDAHAGGRLVDVRLDHRCEVLQDQLQSLSRGVDVGLVLGK